MATSAPASGSGVEVKHVTISPASSNDKLEFTRNFEQVFKPSSSLRGAFEDHAAYKAIFRTEAGRGFRSREPDTTKLPGKIVATSRTTQQTGLTRASKGLTSAIMTAYNTHCALVLSPDDVWLTILSQFCAYVNKNAEGLRDRVVEHEGKKKLTVYGYDVSLETADYEALIKDLLGEIRKNIKSPELADWFRPGFSTTTETDEVCAAATAMASLQAYFEYRMSLTLCGIPSVTMMGTVEDWKLLREKIERLLEFEVQDNPEGNVMEVWVGYLRKVCDGFVESAEHPDSAATVAFWDKVLSQSGGSGVTYTTGWVSAFSCFDQKGNFRGKNTSRGGEFPLITSLCHNVVSCPVTIDDNGHEHDATLFTGQVALKAERGAEGGHPTIRPRNDWCLAVAVK